MRKTFSRNTTKNPLRKRKNIRRKKFSINITLRSRSRQPTKTKNITTRRKFSINTKRKKSPTKKKAQKSTSRLPLFRLRPLSVSDATKKAPLTTATHFLRFVTRKILLLRKKPKISVRNLQAISILKPNSFPKAINFVRILAKIPKIIIR